MKEILVLSGKGGTGKTSLAASLIDLSESCVASDYDVDGSNLPILLQPVPVVREEFSAGQCAVVDQAKCLPCSVCENVCRFEAIHEGKVDSLACEGCGYCRHVCPLGAISMENRSSGRWFEGVSGADLPVFYAELRPGEENSGKLVARVKEAARRKCREQNRLLIIADGPPGIGCPVNSALVGVELVVLVGEPSLSGFHDLQRLHELLEMRGIRSVLVINKYDLNPDLAEEMENWAQQKGMAAAGKIPYHMTFARAAREGKPPTAYGELRELMEPIWNRIAAALE